MAMEPHGEEKEEQDKAAARSQANDQFYLDVVAGTATLFIPVIRYYSSSNLDESVQWTTVGAGWES